MKHFWIGLSLLLGLLALSGAAQFAVTRIHEPIREQLEQAESAVLAEDWGRAGNLIGQARNSWEKHRKIAASLSGHDAIGEIDRLFDRLALLIRLRDSAACAEACRDLAGLSRMESDGQRLTWWNLL